MKNSIDTIPKTMRALVLNAYNGEPKLEEIPVPKPKKGEVLVKIHASPINPSDFAYIHGRYPTQKTLPAVAGFEASGKVIATGPDLLSKRLLGKNVNCLSPNNGNGTWAQYMVTKNILAIPLNKKINLDQGSMMFINPYSAYAMVEMALKEKHTAIANTAAASALGQMMIRLCLQKKLNLVNIVRREEQAAMLKEQGAKYVLNSSSKNFTEELKETFNKLNVTLVYDAIGGEMTTMLADALPAGGKISIYGGLSGSACMLNPGLFIFENKSITGFYLTRWIEKQNLPGIIRKSNTIQKNFSDQFYSKIHKKVSIQNFQEGLNTYLKEMTAGKILIMPNE